MTDFDTIVLGSGAFGSSAAFHLAKSGQHVAVIDKASIASQTSPRAAGLTGQLRMSSMLTRVSQRAVQKFVDFTEETGQPMQYFQTGSISMARTEEHAAILSQGVDHGARLGLETRIISPREAEEMMPFLHAEGTILGLYTPSDVYLEPAQVAAGYANGAAALGTQLMSDTTVTDLVVEHGRVNRVITDRGEYTARNVVVAAGGWLRHLADMAGVFIPVVPMRHQLMITEPIDGADADLPVVRILDVNVYVRPSRGGLMLGGYETSPTPVDTRDLVSDFRIQDLELDRSVLGELADTVYPHFPVFRDAALQSHRGGLPTMTIDGEFVFGPAAEVEGLYFMGGCNVGGLSVSPALGEEMAQWIVTGAPNHDFSAMSPSRFDRSLTEDEIIAKASDKYRNYYLG